MRYFLLLVLCVLLACSDQPSRSGMIINTFETGNLVIIDTLNQLGSSSMDEHIGFIYKIDSVLSRDEGVLEVENGHFIFHEIQNINDSVSGFMVVGNIIRDDQSTRFHQFEVFALDDYIIRLRDFRSGRLYRRTCIEFFNENRYKVSSLDQIHLQLDTIARQGR